MIKTLSPVGPHFGATLLPKREMRLGGDESKPYDISVFASAPQGVPIPTLLMPHSSPRHPYETHFWRPIPQLTHLPTGAAWEPRLKSPHGPKAAPGAAARAIRQRRISNVVHVYMSQPTKSDWKKGSQTDPYTCMPPSAGAIRSPEQDQPYSLPIFSSPTFSQTLLKRACHPGAHPCSS